MKLKALIGPFFATITLVALFPGASRADSDAPLADKLFTNGAIYTLDVMQPWVDTVAVAGDTIIYAGDLAGARSLQTEHTRHYDLQGRMMLPGFIDTHMHFFDTIPLVFAARLSPDMSPEEVIAAIARHAAQHPQQDPVIGSGFLATAFGEQGPTAADLDRAVPDRAAFIFDEGIHSAWINSVAMKAVGLDRDTPDPEPGVHYYKRYPDGTPTGWMLERGAFGPVAKAMEIVTRETLELGADYFLNVMSGMGITSVFDAGIVGEPEQALALLSQLAAQERLPVRLVGSLYITNGEQLPSAIADITALQAQFNHEFFDLRVLKLSLDGSAEAGTAYMLKPYQQPAGHAAQPLIPPGATTAVAIAAAGRGIDLHIHALGDAAVRLGLDMVEKARAKFPDSPSRYTLCHLQMVNPADVARFGKLGVIAQSTPAWYVYDEFALTAFGPQRFQQMYPLRSIAASGSRLTLGSDYPASWIGLDGLNPLFNIEMGITRQLAGDKDYPVQPPRSERISLAQAIRAYTLDAAYQLRLEDQVGSIEVGKQADLVVLSENLFKLDTYRIHETRVDLTMVNGKVVFEKN